MSKRQAKVQISQLQPEEVSDEEENISSESQIDKHLLEKRE